MSVEHISTSTNVQSIKQVVAHPLAPLTSEEIRTASSVLKSIWPQNVDIQFKAVTLEEPPKAEVVPYLEAEHNGTALPHISRKAFISYYLRNTVHPPSEILCVETSI